MDNIPKCIICGRERTIEDACDYNPLQVVTGQPLGWYSADDGEICPQDMEKMLRGAKGRPTPSASGSRTSPRPGW